MKQKLLVITIIVLAVFCVQAFAEDVTITVDSPIGFMTNSDDGSELKSSKIELEQDGRVNVYFSQPTDYPRGEHLDTWGSIMLSSEEDKPVKVYLDKKINIEMTNMPYSYEFLIMSEEKHCYEETINTDEFIFSEIFFTYLDELTTRNFAYLPDFTNDYKITLDGKLNKGEQKLMYEYGPVVLKNGDTITVDEFEVYINGKKIERKTYEPGYSLTSLKCFSFSKGTTILNFGETESNNITITVNSPEGYLLWGNNLRKELNNYEYQNSPPEGLTTIELTKDSSSTSLNRGIIAFSAEEYKPININMKGRAGINIKNLPKDYSVKIYSEETACDKEGKRLQEIFRASLNPVLDKSFYLPDFTNNLKMMIWTLDSKYLQKGYLYDLPELKHGYLMEVNEFTALLNGKEIQKEYFEKKGKEFPPFDCYTFSEDWTKPIEENITQKIRLELTVKDPYLEKPVERASVYVNNKLIGVTSSKGEIIDEVLANKDENKLRISAAGYKTTHQNISGKSIKLSIDLKPQYEPFEIPKGYENYVTANKIYGWVKKKGETKVNKDYISVHSNEPELRGYSFPITSDEKRTVLKQAMSKVKSENSPLLTYDHSCVPEINKNCQAWHDSDYQILETKKGVCSDFATLAVSFGNSYNIPTRRVSISWLKSNVIERVLLNKIEYAYHAFSEVYLSEEEGWKNFDITWKLLDKPCAYANAGSCLAYAKIIDEDKNKETDLTETYACNDRCKQEILDKAPAEMPPAEATSDKYTLLIDISSGKAKVSYRKILGKEDSAKILEIYESVDSNQAAKEISEDVKKGFRPQITISNPTFVLDKKNKEQIEVGANFEFEIPPDELVYTFNNYQEEYDITLITPKNIKAVLPSFDTKESSSDSIKYKFNFEEPGEHTIYAIFNHKKSVVVSNDPLHKALADVLSSHINAKSYTLEEQIPNVERIYIIGDYSYIPSSVENSLIEKNIEVVRFENDDKYISAQIAQGFWQFADEVSVANMYDYASVEEARNYAVEKDIPLLFISPDEIPDYVQKAIEYTGATKTTIKDPKNKTNISTKKEAAQEAKSSYEILIAIPIILIIIIATLLAYKFIKKTNKNLQSNKKHKKKTR